MFAVVKQVSDKAGDIFLPPAIIVPDHSSVIAAIKRHRAARIAELAIFIFSTAVTITTTTLAETGVVTGLWTLPALLISITCWGIFYWLYNLENVYLQNADDSVRQDLAKQHLERLLFETPIENVDSFKQFYPMFAHINSLLDLDIFTDTELQRFETLDLSNCNSKTLLEIAQEQAVDLSFNLEREREEPGRFGSPPCTYKASIKWDGNKESPIAVTKVKQERK